MQNSQIIGNGNGNNGGGSHQNIGGGIGYTENLNNENGYDEYDGNQYGVEGYQFQQNEQHHSYEFHEHVSGWFRKYFYFVERNRKYIFVTWCIILFISLFIGPEFLTLGDDQVDAPHGSEAWKAQKLFDNRFAVHASEIPEIVLSFCKPNTDCDDIRTDEMRAFSKEFIQRIKDYNSTHDIDVIDIMDYYSFEGSLLNDVKEGFISPDHKTTIMNIVVTSTNPTNERRDFLNWLNDQIDELNPDKKKYDIGLTGFDAMFKDSTENTANEMARIDSITLPLAFIILAFMIRSWRLLLLGIFNMVTSLLFAFTLLTIMIKTTGKHPESTSAQLTQVMSLALSLDYSLFLNRRFRDEIKIGASPRKAAFMSLLHAGHVVVMSGSTIVVVFLGFTILPARTIQLDGINCAIAITVSMLVALTNTPAMHLLFPGFFSDFDVRCCRKGKSKRDCFDITPPIQAEEISAVTNGQNGGYTLHGDGEDIRAINDDNNESSSIAKKEVHNMYKSPRFRFTKKIVQWPCNIISVIMLYIIVIPLAYNATRMNINQDILVGLPRKAGSSIRFKEMVKSFSPGSFAPFYVLIALPPNEEASKNSLYNENGEIEDVEYTNTVLSEEFFNMAGDIAQKVIDRAHEHDERFTSANMQSPVLANGVKTTFKAARLLLNLANSKSCINPKEGPLFKMCSAAKEYQFLWNQNVNPQRDAMVITITVPFFPFAQESAKFIDVVQEVLDQAAKDYTKGDEALFKGTEYHLCGFEVGFNALSSHVYHLFPTLLAVTLTGVFIVLGVLLRSAFVVVRLSLTLLLPITAVYGAAVLVYQDGILEWLADSTGKTGGFFWYIPILITSMLVGLALDYDVFLISRVMEHRAAGYDIQASVVKGVCETGGTIAAAGVIMTLVFGGLLLGDGLTTNLCGWMLATGVLVDTFIVNTMLVPALLSFGDSVAWWPTKMPQTNLRGLDDPEFPQE